MKDEEIKKLLTKAKKVIKELKWINAKTYKDFAPHEYVVLNERPEVINLFADLIGFLGVNEKFSIYGYEKEYRYVYIGKYKYWLMGYILNRANIKNKDNESI